jgi:hypothetical protein
VEPCEETADFVLCTAREENDLYAVAGIAPVFVQKLVFNEDDTIGRVSPDQGFEDVVFELYWSYEAWLYGAHPDVHDQVFLPLRASILFSEETAELFKAHIDEFVAQSDTYPITP